MSKRDEAGMLALLRARYTEKAGNGDAWAFMTHVRDAAGHGASRTIDAIAMSLWPSRGLELHGFEVKCDRRDWQRELKEPAKAEALARYMDRWWLLVADAEIVKPGELPPTWGLLVASGNRLVAKVEAPKLEPEPVPRTFLACLLRSACRVAATTPEEIEEARQAEREAWRRTGKIEVEQFKQRVAEYREREQRFMREAGVGYSDWHGGQGVEEVARRLKAALSGDRDLAHLQGRVTRLADDARVLGEQAQRILREHVQAARERGAA